MFSRYMFFFQNDRSVQSHRPWHRSTQVSEQLKEIQDWPGLSFLYVSLFCYLYIQELPHIVNQLLLAYKPYIRENIVKEFKILAHCSEIFTNRTCFKDRSAVFHSVSLNKIIVGLSHRNERIGDRKTLTFEILFSIICSMPTICQNINLPFSQPYYVMHFSDILECGNQFIIRCMTQGVSFKLDM